MLRVELGWTTANPPETARLVSTYLFGVWCSGAESHTEELLRLAALFKDFDEARSQLLDARDVAGEDTHVSGLGGDVDLDAIGLEVG